MFGDSDKKRLQQQFDIVCKAYGCAAAVLEQQAPFLECLIQLVKTYGLTEQINPIHIETMLSENQHQVEAAKEILAAAGKPYPPS